MTFDPSEHNDNYITYCNNGRCHISIQLIIVLSKNVNYKLDITLNYSLEELLNLIRLHGIIDIFQLIWWKKWASNF